MISRSTPRGSLRPEESLSRLSSHLTRMVWKSRWKNPPAGPLACLGKAAAALLGIICSIVSWLLVFVSKPRDHVCYDNRHSKWWAKNLSVPGLEAALCELTYYHRWFNICAALKNNQVSNGHNTTIPDVYYNVCELSEEMFQPLGTELNLHAPTGHLLAVCKKRLVLNSGLAKLLGFSGDRYEPGNT